MRYMVNRSWLLLLSAPLLGGCIAVTHWGSRPDFSEIEVGMSQSEVIEVLGEPEDTAAIDGEVNLTYSFAPWYDRGMAPRNKELYFVRLLNNEVRSYGKQGDFGSTRPPERTININVDEEDD